MKRLKERKKRKYRKMRRRRRTGAEQQRMNVKKES